MKVNQTRTRHNQTHWLSNKQTIGSCVISFVLIGLTIGNAHAKEPDIKELSHRFTENIRPFLKKFCIDCHDDKRHEAQLDLSVYTSVDHANKAHKTWKLVLERLENKEMPPQQSKRKPTTPQRQEIIDWIRSLRQYQANRNAGDPGPVLARRLSNAEYNYTIRDLTRSDIQPTRTFPVDPANEAGFDNSGESLSMSPALLKKYLAAARQVVEHLVLKPEGFAFAPHPVVTNTDRDKYCVKRIVQFYARQPTDYADYFLAAWQFNNRVSLGRPKITLKQIAMLNSISVKYLLTIWTTLTDTKENFDPVLKLQMMWRQLPSDVKQQAAARVGCLQMREYVLQLRKQLKPTFENLYIEGSHKGSQPFILWKNRQYAAHRRNYHRHFLESQNETKRDTNDPLTLTIPEDSTDRERFADSLQRFCSVFPDTFYVSERSRDYIDKEKQQKGRLLSAGFHSMMGYFRDDGPLYDLILSKSEQRELDMLWQELDFVTSAPLRQYTGFIWFERTDSRYMREPQFDFARAEDKDVTTDNKINDLSVVYLEKARRNGGSDVAIKAIEDYFNDINHQIRWVQKARRHAEPSHLESLLEFADRAYRRKVSPSEHQEILDFYHSRRTKDRLAHEEAIQDTVVSILMSPYFCYRLNLAGGTELARRPLSDYELANRLSYFVWSSMPDKRLLEIVDRGIFRRPETLLAETRRMLRDERVRGLATEFGGNWLDIRRFEQHNSVDRKRFPQFSNELRNAMFEEPICFFIDVIQNDRSVVSFFDADHTFVNSVLATHYRINDLQVASGAWTRIDHASRFQRGGLLPMSAFLTKNSPGLRTSPVKRGYWVVRRLLGERIPAPPPNVPELPADETQLGDLTLREVLAHHRDNISCAGCHQRFDSIGLAFENFGPIGELRDKDMGGRPVDTTAMFPNGDRGKGLDGLRRYLRQHRQDDFIDNLCRKLLSYALGRTLLLSDDPLIRHMRAELETHEYRFGTLVETIVTSSQFINKRG